MPGDKGNITRLGTKGQTEIRHIQRFPLIHHGKSRFCDCQNNVTKFPSSSTMASPQQPWVVHHHHFLPSPGEKLNLYIFRFFRSRWENNTHKYTAGTAALSLQAPKNRSEIKFPRSTCDLKGGGKPRDLQRRGLKWTDWNVFCRQHRINTGKQKICQTFKCDLRHKHFRPRTDLSAPYVLCTVGAGCVQRIFVYFFDFPTCSYIFHVLMDPQLNCFLWNPKFSVPCFDVSNLYYVCS